MHFSNNRLRDINHDLRECKSVSEYIDLAFGIAIQQLTNNNNLGEIDRFISKLFISDVRFCFTESIFHNIPITEYFNLEHLSKNAYHNKNHIKSVLDVCDKINTSNNSIIKNAVKYALVFHDIFYDPSHEYNYCEIYSACVSWWVYNQFKNHKSDQFSYNIEFIKIVVALIMYSSMYNSGLYEKWMSNDVYSTHNEYEKGFLKQLSEFMYCDLHVFNDVESDEYKKYDRAIFDEFKGKYDILTFMKTREHLVEKIKSLYNLVCINLGYNLEVQESYKFPKIRDLKIGICIGSFNPIHIGHIDIANQVKDMFDVIYFCQANNMDKEKSQYSITDFDIPYASFKCDSFVHEKINELLDYGNVTIIKGFRSSEDIEDSNNNLRWMYSLGLNKSVNQIYIMTRDEYQHYNSTTIRKLLKLNTCSLGQLTNLKGKYDQ